jgi:outer membrane protein assembly factor BamB
MKLTYQQPLFNLLLILSLTACNASITDTHKIADIPEASGISYCENSHTLIVANDEGSFYEITPEGAILSNHKLGKYDLEGVVCDDEILTFAVEEGALLQVNRKTLKTKLLKLKGKSKEFKISKKAGIEGITKIKDEFYLSIQSKNEKDSKLLIVTAGANHAKVTHVIHHGIIDSAGLIYKDKKLYIVSDKKDKLYIYNLKKNKIKKKIKLPKFAQEGVAFGKDNNIFFADDNGAVMKYKIEELGL